MKQFWSEILLLSIFSIILGLAIAELSLPTFNHLVDKQITINYDSSIVLLLFLLVSASGIIAGLFPSIVLSSFKPVEILSSRLKIGGNNLFNKGLVILQFSLSVFFIFSTIIMSGQKNYINKRNYGFNKDHIIVIPTFWWNNPGENKKVLRNLRNELSRYNDFISVTGSSFNINNTYGLIGASDLVYEGKKIKYCHYGVDYNYIKTMGIKLLQGRDFSSEIPSDESGSVIINETLYRNLQLKDPIGKTINFRYKNIKNPKIIGVVEDFHFESLYKNIEPVILYMSSSMPVSYISIRLSPDNIPVSIQLLKSSWKKVAPNIPLQYTFLDDDVNAFYEKDRRLSKAITYASIFTVIIASLGILGLSSLTVNKRKKEISIRKVFGASLTRIFGLISRQFLYLILIGNLIALPAAFYIMRKWLNNFVYRIEISVWTFLLSLIAALIIAQLTISYHALKAGTANPVDNLRNE
jgi:putative ABC transport system permease protein